MKSFVAIFHSKKKKNENHGIFSVLEDLGNFIKTYFIKKLDNKSIFSITLSFCFYNLFEILKIKNYVIMIARKKNLFL